MSSQPFPFIWMQNFSDQCCYTTKWGQVKGDQYYFKYVFRLFSFLSLPTSTYLEQICRMYKPEPFNYHVISNCQSMPNNAKLSLKHYHYHFHLHLTFRQHTSGYSASFRENTGDTGINRLILTCHFVFIKWTSVRRVKYKWPKYCTI